MKPIIVTIAGGTGSGKSYLAKNIVKSYPKGRVLIIGQDSYYKDISNMDYKNRCAQNFDHPDAIESVLIEDHLNKLLCGDYVYIPKYDFSKHLRKKESRKVKQHAIIIIEGILMLHYIRLHKFYNVKIYIDTPEHIRFNRRMERDMKFRGRNKNSIEKQYYNSVKPMHDKFVEPSKTYADLIIDGQELLNNSINKIKTRVDLALK